MYALLDVLVVASIYLVPTAIGVWRHVVRVERVVIINVLLGWTVVGWFIALAMSIAEPSTTEETRGP